MRCFHFYIDDWLASKHVRRMDAHEERGYLRLLLHAASEADCGLPDDPDELADISLLGAQWLLPTKEECKRFRNQTSADKLRACFFVVRDGLPHNAVSGAPEVMDDRVSLVGLTEGRLYNQRLLREFQYQKEAVQQRSDAGKKSAAARRSQKNERPFNDRSTTVQREGQRKSNNDVSVSVSVSELEESVGTLSEQTSRTNIISFPDAKRATAREEVPVELRAVVNGPTLSMGSPPEPPPTDPHFDVWAEAAYMRHRKHRDKFMAMQRLFQRFAGKRELQAVFDRNHELWCQTPEWAKANGSFAPKLHDWIADDGWLYPPEDVQDAGRVIEVPEL